MGHLVLAQEAFVRLGLDRLVLVPVGRAPHREIEQDPGAAVRMELCELATAGDERLGLSRIELDRDGPSYTAETLRLLRERAPHDELVLVLGADQAAALGRWHAPSEVLALAEPAVAERAGQDASRADVEAALEALGAAGAATFFEMPRIDVSSSLVRRRAAAGEPIRYLVPDAVATAIAARGLYGAAVPAGVR